MLRTSPSRRLVPQLSPRQRHNGIRHLVFLAIDRTLACWFSPDATAVETSCVTRLGPLTVGYILPPTCVALSSAIMSISTHAPNGTCATLTALRAVLV